MSIVKLITEKLNSSIEKKGLASLVVSGGSSPKKIFDELSNVDIEWSKVQVTLVDDRLVDAEDSNSNQRLLNENFFKNKAENELFLPLSEDLNSNNNIKMPFDVNVLGMGEDWHFASLFPNMLADQDAFSIDASYKIFKTIPQGDPFLPRITMNLSLILSSELIILLVKGKAKQNILDISVNNETYPIHYLLKNRKNNFFIEKINE